MSASASNSFNDGGVQTSDAPRRDSISSRSGYLPVSLTRAPIQALAEIAIYIRTVASREPAAEISAEPFTLFSAETVLFDESCRSRLLNHGVEFVYIPIAAHDKFRRQTESQIENIADDPRMAAEAKWAIVYETSKELASELLSQRNFATNLPRLQNVSKAIASMVLSDRSAFEHLFAASHHDFYTATHMVNVGTWMVALAYSMGHTSPDELQIICQAGVLHDVGKTLVSKEVLNKTGQLTADEWASLRAHPALGRDYLQKAGITDPTVLAVAAQHHERLDGSGYPGTLRGEQIHPISKLCAVIDTFDAMTSLRPFKTRAMPVAEAIEAILQESPARFDPQVVTAWTSLLRTVDSDLSKVAAPAQATRERRQAARSAFSCPALVRVQEGEENLKEAESLSTMARDISSMGMSLLMPAPVLADQMMSIHLNPPRRGRTAPKDFTARCIRCRAYDDGWFEVGVKFCSEKSAA